MRAVRAEEPTEAIGMKYIRRQLGVTFGATTRSVCQGLTFLIRHGDLLDQDLVTCVLCYS
jgi:hypothetical protein